MSGIERHMIARGCAFYSPIRYSELPRYYRELDCPDDVAMFQVAPMDKHGYFNFGPSASHLGAMCETARHIIVEVNENMPRCLGGTENGIHISKVNAIVEGSNPPIGELGAGGPATEVDQKVAQLIVDQIPNGACLELWYRWYAKRIKKKHIKNMVNKFYKSIREQEIEAYLIEPKRTKSPVG